MSAPQPPVPDHAGDRADDGPAVRGSVASHAAASHDELPRWRGRIHQLCVPVAVVAGAVLAVASPGGSRRVAVVVYAASMVTLFAVSAAYHRGRWGQRAKVVLRRADHSTILVFIAGTFTPVTVSVAHGLAERALLTGMWAAAAIGVAIRMRWHHARPAAVAAVYATVGLLGVSVLPELFGRAGVAAFSVFTLGGVAYLTGAVVYARRRPDPRPRVFGYHEVFHGFTVVAAVLQFSGVALAVLVTPR